MPTPREQAGGLAEASRLLQEGLQLLEQRRREVDALLEDARERALNIHAEAEERARQITAEAEQQRAELEEQVAALRAEVAALREELAEARASGSRNTQQVRSAGLGEAEARGEVEVSATPPEAPQWGRRVNANAPASGARDSGSQRRRWLPPWLPFVLLMLIGAAIVATNVSGQPGATRSSLQQSSGAPESSTATVNGVNVAGVTASVTTFATEPTEATSTPVADIQAPSPTLVPTPTLPATPTAIIAQATVTLPPSGARITTPVALPDDTGPEGPIVASYTTYSTYTVQPGDTLNQVATQFGVSGDTIMRTSGLINPNLLLPGQVLTIPRDSGWLYRVQPGDSIGQIAMRFGVSVDDLLKYGHLSGNAVQPGQLVFVPDRGTPAPKR